MRCGSARSPLPPAAPCARYAPQHDLEQAVRAVRRFLREPSDAPARRDLDVALLGRDLAGDDAEQRGLAGAVAADQPDPRAGRNARGGAIEQRPAGNADGEIVDDEHAAPFGRQRGAKQGQLRYSCSAAIARTRGCERRTESTLYGKCSACQSASRSGLILASIRKTPGAPSLTQARTGSRSATRPYRRRPCAITTCNSREIRFRKLHDIDRIALTPEEVHFGSI